MGVVLGWDYEHKIDWTTTLVNTNITPVDWHEYVTSTIDVIITIPLTTAVGFRFAAASNGIYAWAIVPNPGQVLIYNGKSVPSVQGLNSAKVICVEANKTYVVYTQATIIPYSFQGTQFGVHSGGYTNTGLIAAIEIYSFITDNNAINIQNLTASRYVGVGASSTDYGYILGGIKNYIRTRTIEKFSFAMNNLKVGVGNLWDAISSSVGLSSANYGYNVGGVTLYGDTNKIRKVSFITDGDDTPVGNLSTVLSYAGGLSSINYGYTLGGWAANVRGGIIHKINFNVDTNATVITAVLTPVRSTPVGYNTTIKGYSVGGDDDGVNPHLTDIDSLLFNTDSLTTLISTLSVGKRNSTASSSNHNGYVAGGQSPTFTDSIEKLNFTTEVNSVSVAVLSVPKMAGAGHQH